MDTSMQPNANTDNSGSILPRLGVEKILDSAPLDDAVCIVAPCCSGKTSAVRIWERRRGQASIWLDIDEQGLCSQKLRRQLLAALEGMAQHSPQAYARLAATECEPSWRSFAEAMAELAHKCGEQTLIFDGFHYVKSERTLCFVRDVVSALLGIWRVIIISRGDLPSVFNELMVKGRLRLIASRELNFGKEEMTAFFQMNGVEPSEQEIDTLHERTEGWPGALNVILMVSRGGALEYNEEVRRYIAVFFEREIWSVLDESTRSFLLKTSVLERLTTASCHAVTSLGAIVPMLSWLLLNGYFVKKLDERETYCYCPVFRDYLLDKLAQSDIDEHELFMKIAWWHFEKGEPERAFQLFYKADNLYGMNHALKEHYVAEHGVEQFIDLFDCITTLDIERLKPYPAIFSRIALLHFLKGELDEMQRLYNIFIQWSEPGALPVTPEDYGEYIWEIGWLSYLNPAEKVRGNKRHERWCNFREYAPHMEKRHASRGAAFRFAPSILRGIRDYSEIARESAEFLISQKDDIPVIREVTSIWQVYLIIAEFLYEIEQFGGVEEIISRIMDLSMQHPYCDIYFVCIALHTKLLRAKGNARELEVALERLEKVIDERDSSFLRRDFNAFKVRQQLKNGVKGLPDYFLAENEHLKDKPYFFLHYRHVTYARGLLSLGEYGEALIILNRVQTLCQKYERYMDLIEVLILKAIAHQGFGYAESACRYMSDALEMGKKYGFIRIFSDEAADIWPILQLVKKTDKSAYLQSVIISCKKSMTASGKRHEERKPACVKLTRTELSILRSLKAGMSYQEISQDSEIRLSTVKSHVHSIYSKLGVNNRTSAVLEAENVGLL